MIELVIVINYTPGYAGVFQEELAKLIEKVYLPTIEMFEDLSLPVVYAMSARTLEILHHKDQSVLDILKRLQQEDHIEIVSKGFSNTCFSGLSERDIYQQLTFLREIEKELLGGRCAGFMPEEGWLDVFAPIALTEKGFQWCLLNGEHYPRNNICKIQNISGMDKERLPALCTYTDQDKRISQQIHEMLQGKIDAKNLANSIFRLSESENEDRPILVLKIDTEILFWEESAVSGLQRMRFFLQCLQSMGNFHITLPGTLFNKQDINSPEICHDFSRDKRLAILLQEAQEAIYAAEKKDPDAAILRKAWKNYLLAQEGEYQKNIQKSQKLQDLYILSCERARVAKRNAKEI